MGCFREVANSNQLILQIEFMFEVLPIHRATVASADSGETLQPSVDLLRVVRCRLRRRNSGNNIH